MERNGIKGCSFAVAFLFLIWVFAAASSLSESNRRFAAVEGDDDRSLRGGRRLMDGPGSSPPLCSRKCGRCRPCRAERTTVLPGARVTMEYYPEAWRCKCGNKVYMP